MWKNIFRLTISSKLQLPKGIMLKDLSWCSYLTLSLLYGLFCRYNIHVFFISSIWWVIYFFVELFNPKIFPFFYITMTRLLQGFIVKQYPAKFRLNALQISFCCAQSTIVAVVVERNPAAWKLGWNFNLLSVAYCVCSSSHVHISTISSPSEL